MKKEKSVKIPSVYGIVFSLYTLFVGVLFIIQTWAIYRSAPQSPYSVESISKHFNQIAIPVWLWIAALAGNILLTIVYPEKETRPKAYIDVMYALSKLKRSLPSQELQEGDLQNRNQRILRGVVYAVCTAILLAVATFSMLTLCNVVYYPWLKSDFFASTNGVADRLVQCVALFLGAFTVACVGYLLIKHSLEKEKQTLLVIKLRQVRARVENKEEFAEQQQEKTVVSKQKKDSFPHIKAFVNRVELWWKQHQTVGVWSLRAVIFVLSAVLLIVGVCNGGMKEVLLKAINICTQCIGLG